MPLRVEAWGSWSVVHRVGTAPMFIFLWCLPWLLLVKMPVSFQKGLWAAGVLA